MYTLYDMFIHVYIEMKYLLFSDMPHSSPTVKRNWHFFSWWVYGGAGKATETEKTM